MEDNGGCLVVVLIGILVIALLALVVYGPIFTIWALNLLFGLEIPVNFWTWLSTLWITMIVSGSGKSGISSINDSLKKN